MTVLAADPAIVRLPLRVIRTLRDLLIGTILCLSPLTSVLVLGWQSRSMAARIDARFGRVPRPASWILGPRGQGWFIRLFGGLAANIRAGIVSLLGLAALTLPFTVLWLGAWWAGWENSFNKGYEQAAVGPLTWFLGSFIALPILAHLPLAFAHASAERRLGAFFEWRRIRSVFSASGVRVVWLAILSVALSLPFLGMRALPVFVEKIVPGFAGMSTDEQVQVSQTFDLVGATLAFAITLFLRHRAAAVYCLAVSRAAQGRKAKLWANHPARNIRPYGKTPPATMSLVWLVAACVIWFGIPALIVIGQFMNYAPVLWLTHATFLLPWAG